MSERPSPNLPRVTADKQFEFFQDYIKTVLGLATGALVLSITFLHDVIGLGGEGSNHPAKHIRVLGASWICLLLSVLSALVYLYFHALASRDEDTESWPLDAGAWVACSGLLAGLVLLSIFGWLNVR